MLEKWHIILSQDGEDEIPEHDDDVLRDESTGRVIEFDADMDILEDLDEDEEVDFGE